MNKSVLALAALLVIAFAGPASAMTPATAKYLRSIGIDPKSKEVVAADKEGTVKTEYRGDPEEFSLDIMAGQKRVKNISIFLVSRSFIRSLKKDLAGTSVPKTNYDALYLTLEERELVVKKFQEQASEKKD